MTIMANDKREKFPEPEHGNKRSIPPSKPTPKEPVTPKPTAPSSEKK